MIGQVADGWKWAQASALSVVAHAAVLGYLVWQPSFDFLNAVPPTPLAQLEITPLPAQTQPEIPQVAAETLTSTGGESEVLSSDSGSETISSGDLNALTTPTETTLPVTDPLTSAPSEQILTSTIDPGPAPSEGPGPETLPVQSSNDAEPPDPRMLELVERIRDRLTEPCMLALPMMRGEEELQLNVVSDSDRNITALMDDLTTGIDGEIAREAVLLDSRQCPAVAFVRRDQHYPVYALGIQLDSQQIARGASLRGQITNAAGYYQSLLLVDENGVVHDMRRFLLTSSRMTRFDFAVARFRQVRDTHQMLVALATPERPATVSTHAGEQAEAFFAALFEEVGQNALIGVSSFYVQ